jgi:hypothetical protein
MKAMEITEDELFKAIEEYILESPEPGLEPGTTTTPRVMARYNIGRIKARRLINMFVTKGLLVPDKIRIVDDWGYSQHIRGFRWVNGKD